MDATGRPSQQLLNAQKELARRRRMASVNRPVCTAQFALRCADAASVFGEQLPVGREQLSVDEKNSPVPSSRFSTTGSALHVPNSQSQVRISPTLAAHCLNRRHRHNNAALDGPFRLYKVLGALDREGRGWLSSSDVEAALTKKESAAYIYGRRQLKSILRRGEGLFWQRVKSKGRVRIRLVSRAKVAQALGCGRLRGQEVEIPLSYLLGSGRGRQAAVNAALYTAVHAGHLRRDRARSGQKRRAPSAAPRCKLLPAAPASASAVTNGACISACRPIYTSLESTAYTNWNARACTRGCPLTNTLIIKEKSTATGAAPPTSPCAYQTATNCRTTSASSHRGDNGRSIVFWTASAIWAAGAAAERSLSVSITAMRLRPIARHREVRKRPFIIH